MEEYLKKINETANYLKTKIDINLEDSTAIIIGSGLGSIANEIEDSTTINYTDIPNIPLSTVKGHEGKLIIGKLNNRKVVVLDGRVHYYEGYSMQEITMMIRVLNLLGVKKIIITNASGGINRKLLPSDIMLVSDHINMSFSNPLVGKNLDNFGTRFPNMNDVYNSELRKKIMKECIKKGIKIYEGVYAYMPGPMYETTAEINMLKSMGSDAVGMSTVPEVIVARHCNMKICCISCITDSCLINKDVNHDSVLNAAKNAEEKMKTVVYSALDNI